MSYDRSNEDYEQRAANDARDAHYIKQSNNMLTLDEMKLAVAKLLPEQLFIHDEQVYRGTDMTNLSGKPVRVRVMETEWLHVCGLIADEWKRTDSYKSVRNKHRDYTCMLITMSNPDKTLWEEGVFTGSGSDAAQAIDAAWQLRLEVICRVAFPEMFANPIPAQ